MKQPRFNTADLESVIETLDDIRCARDITDAQMRGRLAALGRLIREHRWVRQFNRIENFLEILLYLADIGEDIHPESRQRAGEWANWCRAALKEVA